MDDVDLLSRLHDGIFTTREAMTLGVSRKALSRAVAERQIRRLARGLYATGPRPPRPEDRHLELCRALLVEYPDALLAGRSAVVAAGLPTWGLPLGRALLHRPVVRQLKRSGAVIRPVDPGAEVVRTSIGPATSLPEALVQIALDHGTAPALVSTDAALHRGLVGEEDLLRWTTAHAGHRHVQRALATTRLTDSASESPGETRLRLVLATAGIDVESQYVIRDQHGRVVARSDFRVEGARVLVEFDGLVKYADGGPETLAAEKRREDELRAMGWIVVRVVWSDLDTPARIVAAVRRAMAVAAAGHPAA